MGKFITVSLEVITNVHDLQLIVQLIFLVKFRQSLELLHVYFLLFVSILPYVTTIPRILPLY